MDIGSILNNALGGFIGSLGLILLTKLIQQILVWWKQRKIQPKETLENSLFESQEYQEILQRRKSFRMMGYMMLFALISYLGAFIAVFIGTSKIPSSLDAIVIFILLFLGTPMELYVGYSSITSHEVEQKRQANREKAFKEAQGKRPYGYIVNEIFWPIIMWLVLMINVVALFLLLPLLFHMLHIPNMWAIVIIGFVILVMVYCTYLDIRQVRRAIKNLRNVPRQRQQQLRQQFQKDESEQ